MRILLAIYILFVTVVPCHCDIYAACESHGALQCISETQHGDEQTVPDVCTPFCSCAGSHSANFYIPLFSTPRAYEHCETRQFFYLLKTDDVFASSMHTPPEYV